MTRRLALIGLLVVSLMMTVWGCGGTTAGSFQSRPTNVPLVERNYTFVAHGLKGEACKKSFLGFGIGDQSYVEAIGKIHEQIPVMYKPEYQLVNVVDDWTFNFYLLVWESCTVVSADVVTLGDPVRQERGPGNGSEPTSGSPGGGFRGGGQPGPGPGSVMLPEPSPTRAPVTHDQMMVELKNKRPAIMVCLSKTYTKKNVTLTIHIGSNGSFQSADIQEKLPQPTQDCIRNVLGTVSYPTADEEYAVDYLYPYKAQ